ncbi:hypothetical protein ACEPAH_7025 [Sanghuangporus vaninii]
MEVNEIVIERDMDYEALRGDEDSTAAQTTVPDVLKEPSSKPENYLNFIVRNLNENGETETGAASNSFTCPKFSSRSIASAKPEHTMSPFQSLQSLSAAQLILLSLLSLPALFILKRVLLPTPFSAVSEGILDEDDELNEGQERESTGTGESETGSSSVMSAENPELDPPKDTPFRLEELREFDGSDPSKPIYVSIKGTVFDVSNKREMYGPGKSYNIFAGKDGSRGLGMSSLKDADAVPDYSTLPPSERKVLDDWHSFFSKRYNIVGRVVDLPGAVANL